jgi:phosphate-selective porin OprO/OprP
MWSPLINDRKPRLSVLVALFLAASIVIRAGDDVTPVSNDETQSDPGPKKHASKTPKKFRWSWDQGPRYDLEPIVPVFEDLPPWAPEEKRHLRGRIGAKAQVDAAMYWRDQDFGGIEDDIELRRFRLYSSASTFFIRPLKLKLEVGWEDNEWYLHDTFSRFEELPGVGSVTLGNFKTPMSLEVQESSRDTTFMETASVVEAFAPGFRVGIAFGGPWLRQRLTWNFGWFVQAQDFEAGDASKNPFGFIGRATWLPVYENDESSNRLIHLGMSASESRSAEDTFRFRSRPESHLAPRFVDTGDITSDRAVTYGLETAARAGRYSLQSEFMQTFLEHSSGNSLQFYGLYVYGSCFLTRDSRTYNKVKGAFGRVSPRTPFSLAQGQYGAIEMAVRFSRTDLSDGDVKGGTMNIVMGGINWYLSDQARFSFNLGFVDVQDTEERGNLNLGQTRIQFYF